MSRKLRTPAGGYRKSLAVYYLSRPTERNLGVRIRTLFAPREEQKGDPHVDDLIRRRVNPDRSHEVYRDRDERS